LRLLAESWSDTEAPGWTPRAVITTTEGLDNATRALLTTTFKTTVYDFYGLSEMGLIGWECPAGGGYHLAEDFVITEFLPVDGNQQLFRLVLTNLAQRVMPFIRYDTGDLCVPVDRRCACGRTFSLVSRFEGRQVDCIVRIDGTKISPYRITCEFERLDDVARYQVRQEDYGRFTVLLESARSDTSGLGQSAVNCLNGILGMEADITVRVVPKIEQAAGRKFRVVESRVAKTGNETDPGTAPPP
jgi:phenylacetate-CoA ligase